MKLKDTKVQSVKTFLCTNMPSFILMYLSEWEKAKACHFNQKHIHVLPSIFTKAPHSKFYIHTKPSFNFIKN